MMMIIIQLNICQTMKWKHKYKEKMEEQTLMFINTGLLILILIIIVIGMRDSLKSLIFKQSN